MKKRENALRVSPPGETTGRQRLFPGENISKSPDRIPLDSAAYGGKNDLSKKYAQVGLSVLCK